MYVDFAIINTDLDEKQAKQQITEVATYGIDSLCLPYYLVKSCKYLIDTDKVDFSCLIDFPIGVSDAKTRKFAVEQAIDAGVNTIDITMPQNLAANRKYDKIRDDIKSIKEACEEKKIKIRYVLEYRVFDHHCLKKICEIFDNSGIQYAYPSTGYFIDNLADNLIACSFLHQNSKDVNIICSGNSWLNKHFELIYKSGIYGLRTYSPHVIKSFREYLADIEKNNNHS